MFGARCSALFFLSLARCVSHRFHAPFVVGSISVLFNSFAPTHSHPFDSHSITIFPHIYLLLSSLVLTHICSATSDWYFFSIWPKLSWSLFLFAFSSAFQNKYHTSIVPIIYYVNHSNTLFFIIRYCYYDARCVFVCACVKFFFWYLQSVFVVVVFFTWDDLLSTHWCVTTKCFETNGRQTGGSQWTLQKNVCTSLKTI